MRREGDACRPDSLVRPVPLPEHLPLPQEPIIEDVIENESDKQVITDEPKGEIPAEQDTGMRGMFDRTDCFPSAYSLTTSRDALWYKVTHRRTFLLRLFFFKTVRYQNSVSYCTCAFLTSRFSVQTQWESAGHDTVLHL